MSEKPHESATAVTDTSVVSNNSQAYITRFFITQFISVKPYSFLKSVNKCAKAVQAYQNSFVGVMKAINKDYDATKLNVEELMATLDQPDKVGLVKEILEKIG